MYSVAARFFLAVPSVTDGLDYTWEKIENVDEASPGFFLLFYFLVGKFLGRQKCVVG